MLSDRKEGILGAVAFISGLFLFIAIVGYADTPQEPLKPGNEVTTQTPSPSPCETPTTELSPTE